MSDAIGPVAVLPLAGRGPLLPGTAETSQATQQLLDQRTANVASLTAQVQADKAAIGEDGTYHIEGVKPGEYVVTVRSGMGKPALPARYADPRTSPLRVYNIRPGIQDRVNFDLTQ